MVPVIVRLAAGLAVIGSPSATQSPGAADLHCGSYCLYVALSAIGHAPESFEQLETSLGPPSSEGYSMRQLEEQARKQGAETIAVKTTLDNLQARAEPFACIALLKKGHFVVLYDSDESYAYVINPPERAAIPLDTFRTTWTGDALLIGTRPFQPEELVRPPWRITPWIWGVPALAALVLLVIVLRRRFGLGRTARASTSTGLPLLLATSSVFVISGCRPGSFAGRGEPNVARNQHATLRVDPAIHRLGSVVLSSKGETVDVQTVLHNTGGAPLDIRKIRVGCSCTTVALDRSEIPPGSRAILTSRIRLGHEPGPRRSSLTIESSDPERPSVGLLFEWQAVN